MFKSFQTRLVVFFAGLLVLALAATFIAVHRVSVANAHRVIESGLGEDAAVFRRLLDERTWHLLEAAQLLSSDFAFKSAYATGDDDTLLSAMNNHLGRISGGDWMMLVSPDGRLLVDTDPRVGAGRDNPWPRLVAAAEADPYGEAAGMVTLGDRLFQMMVVPLLVPDLAAWILVGFEIDDAYARDLGELIRSEVAILANGERGEARLIAGTVTAAQSAALAPLVSDGRLAAGDVATVELGGERFVASVIDSSGAGGARALVVLQRSLTAELAPYARLQMALLVVFAAGLGMSIVAAVMIARSVTRPVLELAGRARRIVTGDYSRGKKTRRRDEVGMLSRSFDHMVRGLAEKERVRALLGKVVSPAIAEELLSKEIELGGEERVVTVLFSDVRNFTSFSEGRKPREVLSLLNLYLTDITGIIERHGGVVDKYMGDAVMALFGAPLEHPGDAERAVATGLEMHDALERLNARLGQSGRPTLECGIGINTDLVVAGNMGSETRLNYTVIGDGVNLAARFEGLTRRYRVPLIVSDATRREAPGFVYRELDRVRVKGKRRAVAIFQPLGRVDEIEAARVREVEQFHDALERMRGGDYAGARDRFRTLADGSHEEDFYRCYLERAERLLRQPPRSPWDGTVEFADK